MLFLLIFSRFFLMTFFLLAKLFRHISCKNPLKPVNIYHILHLPYPQIFFIASMVEKYQGIPSNEQKLKLLGGGCIPPFPGICSPDYGFINIKNGALIDIWWNYRRVLCYVYISLFTKRYMRRGVIYPSFCGGVRTIVAEDVARCKHMESITDVQQINFIVLILVVSLI